VVHDPALLDALERLDTENWQGRVFRHMLGSASPELANVRGARWNPPGTSALYTSLTEATAKAEGDHLIAMQPVPPRAPRTIYELEIAVTNLLDLTDTARLAAISTFVTYAAARRRDGGRASICRDEGARPAPC